MPKKLSYESVKTYIESKGDTLVSKEYNNKDRDRALLNRTFGLYNNMEAMGLADIILILFFKPLIRGSNFCYMSAMYNGGRYTCDGEILLLNEIPRSISTRSCLPARE